MSLNRIDKLFAEKQNLLSIYFTAGYPKLDDTRTILDGLQAAGADFVEIGMPFSDPLADGPVIQRSSLDALNNGISIKKLFEQLANVRPAISMPIILMGYINPVMHFGLQAFIDKCKEVGVDGVIIPDCPFDLYISKYKVQFDAAGIKFIPLIAPQTSDERMRHIDANTEGFIYMVASAGITGNIKTSQDYRTIYYERVRALKLKNKTMIGFGIKDNASYTHACQHADGAIIGTAFVQHLTKFGTDKTAIANFIKAIKG
jgi:tryptophan synthase alpha chain